MIKLFNSILSILDSVFLIAILVFVILFVRAIVRRIKARNQLQKSKYTKSIIVWAVLIAVSVVVILYGIPYVWLMIN